nr:TPA_asm: P3 [Cucurbita betacytorhabdovirus 1]
MASNNVEFFKGTEKKTLFSPMFKKSFEIINEGCEIQKEMKFPMNIKDMFSSYPCAKIRSILVNYEPYITLTSHGVIRITICDQRKSFSKEKNVCILENPTEIQTEYEIKDLEPCSRDQKNPITISVIPDLRGLSPNAIIGKITIIALFSYSKNMFSKKTPSIEVHKIGAEGYEITKNYQVENTMLKISVISMSRI